jgi:hypothetical protein
MTQDTRYSRAALESADELFPVDQPHRSARLDDVTRTVRSVFLNAVAQLEAAYPRDPELPGVIGILASALVSHSAALDDIDTPTGIGVMLRVQVSCHAQRLDVCPASIFAAFIRGIPKAMAEHRSMTDCENDIAVELEARPVMPHTRKVPKGEPS